MMTEWNPVEGLKKLSGTDVRVGDVVRIKQGSDVDRYLQIVVKNVQELEGGIYDIGHSGGSIWWYPDHEVYELYLVQRPEVEAEEPEGVGDVVYVFDGDDDQEIYVFVRIRHKNQDRVYGNKAWVEESGRFKTSWSGVLKKVNELDRGQSEVLEAKY